MKYRIVLLDNMGNWRGERGADTIKQAKAEARYMLSDAYAAVGETTHDDTCKVEVYNDRNECVFDLFHKNAKLEAGL